MTAAVVLFAVLVMLFVSQSARIGRAFLTAPIVFTLAGGMVGRTVLDAEANSSTIRTIAEITLALMLFHDAAQLQPRELRADSVFTARLLLIGLPLTIGAGYLLARGLFPDTGIWLALLLAAALGCAPRMAPGPIPLANRPDWKPLRHFLDSAVAAAAPWRRRASTAVSSSSLGRTWRPRAVRQPAGPARAAGSASTSTSRAASAGRLAGFTIGEAIPLHRPETRGD